MEAGSSNALAERVVGLCLPFGLAIVGLAVLVTIAEAVMSYFQKPSSGKHGPSEHGSLEGAAKLAEALKGLDASGRLVLVGLALVAFAATAAGLDAVSPGAEAQETEQGE